MLRNITLKQLLAYFDPERKPVDRVQVVSWKQEWEQADELSVNSDLLDPIRDCQVMAMECTESYIDKKPVLKVLIDRA